MSLAPSASVTLGQQVFATHAMGLTVSLAMLPGVNSFRVLLPAAAGIDAAPGDPAALSLDGGEGEEIVLTGKLRRLHRAVAATEAIAADGGADLAAARPAATYQKQGAREVIQALASDAGVDAAGVDADLAMAAYVADQSGTAGEHIARLSRLAGATARMNADGQLLVDGPPSGPADLALRYGREIVDYQVRRAAPPPARVAIGIGPAGSADAPDALRLSKDTVPSDAAGPAMDKLWAPAAILRTARAAAAASAAYAAGAAAAAQALRCRCFLLPKLRPGMVVEVQDLPDGLAAGPWQVTRVTHRVTAAEAGSTVFEADSAASGGGGLLGAALAAVGGLL